jgi:ketosteroid isomerase-like protein
LWIEVLEAAEAKHWTREISAEEETELERRRRAVEAESLSKRKRADFFRRRGGLLIAAAVLVVVGAFVAGDMIRAQRDKPDFSKLPPADVVRHYYAALDGLDMESLEACGDKKAFDADWNYVMTMTVVTKTRTAYEGKDPIIRAKDWLAAGKPELEQTAFLYGLVDLAIADEGGSGAAGNEKRFRATYSVWSMDRKDDPSGDPSKVIASAAQEKRVDELGLRRGDKGGWRIVSLTRRIAP